MPDFITYFRGKNCRFYANFVNFSQIFGSIIKSMTFMVKTVLGIIFAYFALFRSYSNLFC